MVENDKSGVLRDMVEQVMEVDSVVLDAARATVWARGELRVASDAAFEQLQSNMVAHGHVPIMYRDGGQAHVLAVDKAVMVPSRPLYWLAGVLFAVTVVRIFQLGIQMDAGAPLQSVADYFSNFGAGVPFAVAMLAIILSREVARFLVARVHGIQITWPFFIPLINFSLIFAPLLQPGRSLIGALLFRGTIMPWGTLGGTATLRAPARDRRAIFDMSVAATLAGLVASVVVLVIGLFQSELTVLNFTQSFFMEGQSLFYRLVKLAVFGQWLPQFRLDGMDVSISTLALAGWAGLLITMIHLMPFGSLDGGNILYSLVGNGESWGRVIVIIALVVFSLINPLMFESRLRFGISGYQGWLLWLAIILLFMRNRAQVLDEITTLGMGRRLVGIGMFVLLLLLFMPFPFRPVPVLIVPGA